MTPIITFIIGLCIGALAGIGLMAVLAMAHDPSADGDALDKRF